MSDNGHITWANDTRKLGDLVPWEHNPREINTKEAERLGDSLVEFGQIQTIAIGPDGEVYDGHQRKAVWSLLPAYGPEHLVDVRVSSRPLTEQERQKLVVYLHRGTAGTWDWDELANSFEVPDLLEWGFEESELQLDWGDDAEPDPGAQVDKAAELQEKWQVARGQVWQVGRHRVMCGDSTCAEDVARLMGGKEANTLVSDPPYGIGYEYESHDDSDNAVNLELVRNAFALAPTARVWTCGMMNLARDMMWNPGARVLCWHKKFSQAGNGLGGASTWEPVIVSGVHGGKLPNDYLEFPTDRIEGLRELHTCPKPVALFVHLMQALAGACAYDPFLGSGTTLVACEQTNRIGYGMEIEPKYVAVTLERLTGMGLEAVLVEPVIQAGTGG